jgi:hypothetical protein
LFPRLLDAFGDSLESCCPLQAIENGKSHLLAALALTLHLSMDWSVVYVPFWRVVQTGTSLTFILLFETIQQILKTADQVFKGFLFSQSAYSLCLFFMIEIIFFEIFIQIPTICCKLTGFISFFYIHDQFVVREIVASSSLLSSYQPIAELLHS